MSLRGMDQWFSCCNIAKSFASSLGWSQERMWQEAEYLHNQYRSIVERYSDSGPSSDKIQTEWGDFLKSYFIQHSAQLSKAPRPSKVVSPSATVQQLYYICPHCGRPSPTDEHACKCGYRLSDMLPAYRLRPDCNRFVPQSQVRCECGHSFPAEEKLLHVCPACGLVLPLSQQKCDCGYQFQPSRATAPLHPQPAAPSPDNGAPIPWPPAAKAVCAVVVCAAIILLIYFIWQYAQGPSAATPPAPATSASQAVTPAPIASASPSVSPSDDPLHIQDRLDAMRDDMQHSASTMPPPQSLTPQGRPLNGYILRGSSLDRLAPLTIQTDEGSDYFISLCAPGASRATMTFFVRGGQTAEVTVPLGVYEIFYAYGQTWYGTSDLFGPDTMYTKCDGTFEFSEDDDGYSGWTLTLYQVANGNMSTEDIDSGEFPM